MREEAKSEKREKKVQVRKNEKKRDLDLNESNLEKVEKVSESRRGTKHFRKYGETKSVKGEIKSEKQKRENSILKEIKSEKRKKKFELEEETVRIATNLFVEKR